MFTLLIIELVLLFFLGATAESDNDIGSFLLTAAVVITALFFIPWNIDLIAVVQSNITSILFFVAAYFVVGAVWSVLKWTARLSSEEIQEKIRNEYKSWKERSVGTDTKFEDSYFYSSGNLAKNKARIVRWIVWWPASVLWNLTYRFIRRLSLEVYKAISKLLQNITNHYVSKAVSGIKEDPEPEANTKVVLNEEH